MEVKACLKRIYTRQLTSNVGLAKYANMLNLALFTWKKNSLISTEFISNKQA